MTDERGFPDSTLNELFKHHPPSDEQRKRYEAIRAGALAFAALLREHVPVSSDRTDAVRKLRECVMTANAAIALEEARR